MAKKKAARKGIQVVESSNEAPAAPAAFGENKSAAIRRYLQDGASDGQTANQIAEAVSKQTQLAVTAADVYNVKNAEKKKAGGSAPKKTAKAGRPAASPSSNGGINPAALVEGGKFIASAGSLEAAQTILNTLGKAIAAAGGK